MFREDGNVYIYMVYVNMWMGCFACIQILIFRYKATDILRIYCTCVHLNVECNVYFFNKSVHFEEEDCNNFLKL